MKQNTVIHILLGLALLPPIAFFYFWLAPHGQPMTTSGWILLISAELLLILAVFAPILVRRMRGLPAAPPLSSADIRFMVALIVVLCPLTFWACMAGGAYGSLLIMVVPIAFLFRFQRRISPDPSSRNG